MIKMMEKIDVKTTSRNQMIDITAQVQELVKKSGLKNGLCFLFVPHTTAGITINEDADPSVKKDILNKLSQFVPESAEYLHTEGNADAHIKSTLVGCSQTVFIEKSELVLGTWQGIMFCEFDGPRNRKVIVKVIEA